jgi:hypothetical protein
MLGVARLTPDLKSIYCSDQSLVRNKFDSRMSGIALLTIRIPPYIQTKEKRWL